jgi:predicted ATPase
MRLQTVWISEYKNLKNFTLNFDSNSFIDVFVGKNGTGKSNLLEALIEIFQHLYEFDKAKNEIHFEYSLKYEIANTITEISWKEEKLFIDGNERKSIDKTLLPDNILIYYSGHNTKITCLVDDYEKTFKSKIKTAEIKETRYFIGIGEDYKQLLLTVLLLQQEKNNAKKFICKKLGILKLGKELRLVLKRPFYAKNKPSEYDVDPGDVTTKYWKAAGITADFLKLLDKCKVDDTKGPVRDSGYYGKEHSKYPDQYILYFDINKIQKELGNVTSQELFRLFDNLKTIEMLQDISISFTLFDGSYTSTHDFSDGQFQLVYIYSIIELFKDRNCITLLDEPDSFLHPEWQFEFLKQVFEITDTTLKNNHILMSSHSAVTLVPHNNREIKLFHFTEGKLCCHNVNKKYAVDQLASNVLRYSENEQILSILNTINIERKPVFFTEGSSDPVIIKEAWQRLYRDPMPFIPIYAFNCVYLRMLLQDNRIFNELGKKPLFGLFDFDEAYNEWNYLKEAKKGRIFQKNPYKGLIISIKGRNSFACMLPIPKIAAIEKQVIKNKAKKETYCHESRMTIEHLFYGDPQTHSFFENENTPGGSVLVFKEDKKTFFANDIVPKIESKYFEVFRPMFEFVKSKCNTTSAVKITSARRSRKNNKTKIKKTKP